MEQQLAQREVARLEAVVRGEGGTTAFPALSEAQRRAGRPEEAERVAREGLRRHPDHPAGRVALGLALLDLGRIDEARGELMRVVDAVPDHPVARAALPDLSAEPVAEAELMDDLDEGELDHAFAVAEPDTGEMMDANGVAEAVVRAVEREPDEAEASPAAGPTLGAAADSPFATRSMADILERQGRSDEAQRIRENLDSTPAADEAVAAAAPQEGREAEEPPERERVVRKLEGWLDNLRKGRR